MTAIAVERETNNFWNLIRNADKKVKVALITRLSASLIDDKPNIVVGGRHAGNPLAALDSLGEAIRATGKSPEQLVNEHLQEKYAL